MVGACYFHGSAGLAYPAGRAYVFTKSATGWQQAAELVGPDTVAGDEFGNSVAATDRTIVVGASGAATFFRVAPTPKSSAGRAYVFTKATTGWHLAAELVGSDTTGGDELGASVGVSGSTIVAGAPGAGIGLGQVYVFEAQTSPTPPPVTIAVPTTTTTTEPSSTTTSAPTITTPTTRPLPTPTVTLEPKNATVPPQRWQCDLRPERSGVAGQQMHSQHRRQLVGVLQRRAC